jgi:imidazolonepropionase-like amidohydrolase
MLPRAIETREYEERRMGRVGWLAVFAAMVALNSVGQQSTAAGAATTVTVIRAGTLIDGKSETPKHNQVIVIRNHRIESVGDAATTQAPAGATVLDLSQATVLPGLIDSHTHIFCKGKTRRRADTMPTF